MTTKFDVGEEVYIKAKVVEITVKENGICRYDVQMDSYPGVVRSFNEDELTKKADNENMDFLF